MKRIRTIMAKAVNVLVRYSSSNKVVMKDCSVDALRFEYAFGSTEGLDFMDDFERGLYSIS
jgi:hypothetical protein